MAFCSECGREKPDAALTNGICVRCQLDRSSGEAISVEPLQGAERDLIITQRASTVILTTSIDVPAREIDCVITIVASEVALGVNIFRDIANNWRDFVGGRSNSAQKSLKEARAACLDELKREAAAVGADAVIAVDLDYNELSTSGSSGILFVAASGTAVKLKPPTAI